MHSFTGDLATAEACVAMGLYISFAGMLTYKNAGGLPGRAQRVPLDRLVVETDCPYLPTHPYRGQRNEPAHIRLTAIRLAELHDISMEALEQATTANAARLFPALAILTKSVVTSERGLA